MDGLQEEFATNWKNKQYGGSVLDPVSHVEYKNGVKTIHRLPNNLLEDMTAMDQRLSGEGRLFNVENVLVYQNENFGYFADINFLSSDMRVNMFDRNTLEFA
jgi:hypothetical protein